MATAEKIFGGLPKGRHIGREVEIYIRPQACRYQRRMGLDKRGVSRL
jgi:hypothetical protein